MSVKRIVRDYQILAYNTVHTTWKDYRYYIGSDKLRMESFGFQSLPNLLLIFLATTNFSYSPRNVLLRSSILRIQTGRNPNDCLLRILRSHPIEYSLWSYSDCHKNKMRDRSMSLKYWYYNTHLLRDLLYLHLISVDSNHYWLILVWKRLFPHSVLSPRMFHNGDAMISKFICVCQIIIKYPVICIIDISTDSGVRAIFITIQIIFRGKAIALLTFKIYGDTGFEG